MFGVHFFYLTGYLEPRLPTSVSIGDPEASRLAASDGRVIGFPSVLSASSSPDVTAAKYRQSSARMKRCARTPLVARPFAGNSASGVHFALPGSVPGMAAEELAQVTTFDSLMSLTTLKLSTVPSGDRLIPATPPAARP